MWIWKNILKSNLKKVKLNQEGSDLLTRMDAVAGDAGALQPLGKLVGEEGVTQFAVTVLLEHLIVAATLRKILVSL